MRWTEADGQITLRFQNREVVFAIITSRFWNSFKPVCPLGYRRRTASRAWMTMDYQEAKDLILHEGTTVDGIHVCVRMGDDPGHERMMRIAEAIDVMIANEDLGASIERKMAYSLFVIAHETEVQSTSWQEQNQWRDGGFFEDLTVLQEKVFEYLEGSLEFDETD